MEKWYLLKTQNNYERVIAEKLTKECNASNVNVRCVVPMERTYTNKNGKKELKETVYMAGYVYVKTDSVGEVYNIARLIQGVQGFMKDKKSNQASTLSSRDERQLYKLIGEETTDNTKTTMVIESPFKVGDNVIINNGAYEGMKGYIKNIDNNIIDVIIKIFNKEVNVELYQQDINLQ